VVKKIPEKNRAGGTSPVNFRSRPKEQNCLFFEEEKTMELKIIAIDNPDQLNFILGHSHFIKTVEDLYEAIATTVPGAKFGLAFCEASDVCLVRHAGTDEALVALAQKNALNLAAGHSFIIFLRDMFPVNILNTIKNVPEVCRIFCATANPVEVIIAQSDLGRGIMGVIDGFAAKGIEGPDDIAKRKTLLRAIGYKL
jgi:uncharacterized protein